MLATRLPDNPGSSTPGRLAKALLTLVAWAGATMLLGVLTQQDNVESLGQLVTALASGVALNIVAGLAVLLLATAAFRWSDLGFRAPDWRALGSLTWFPLLTLLPFGALALAIGLPSGRVIGFLALNTLLIALSEEWMFRGVLFGALRDRAPLWLAVVASSVGFGALHVLNAFALGDLGMALAQSVAAMMTGTLLVALLLRTGSIWVPVAYHMLWNFGILLVAYRTSEFLPPAGPAPFASYLMPVAVVLPNFVFALFLLRKVATQRIDR